MEEFITASITMSKQKWKDCSTSIVLVFPHSHANIYENCKEIINLVSAKIDIHVISMPCCFLDLQTLTIEQARKLNLTLQWHNVDLAVHSEMNDVFVWKRDAKELLEFNNCE